MKKYINLYVLCTNNYGNCTFKIEGKCFVYLSGPTKVETCSQWLRFMVFNATFNNISVISWSVLLVEETGKNQRPAARH